MYFEVPGQAAPWQHGPITRQLAEARIEAEGIAKPIEGLYLVREKVGDDDAGFVLSVWNGSHFHHRIRQDTNGSWLVEEEDFGPLPGLGHVLEAIAARYAMVPRPLNSIFLGDFVPSPSASDAQPPRAGPGPAEYDI